MRERVAAQSSGRSRTNLRAVAFPAEHGGWGFLLEPILLGLLVAPSWRGLALGLAALWVFLSHQPLKLALRDVLKRRHVPRTALAIRFAVGYGGLALLCFALAGIGIDAAFVIPLLMALPLASIQVYADVRSQSRSLLAELSGSLALGASAASIAVLGGWTLSEGLLLWALTGLRTVPSIYYVRARLRVERDKAADKSIVTISHVASILIALGLVPGTSAPWIAVPALLGLAARAAKGLSPYRKPMKAKEVGIREMVYGFAYVILIAIGYSL